MKKDIVVIGGGFAGASAASLLAERGYPVALIEQKNVLGGRACSFRDAATGEEVDNGQHLFMNCYDDTVAFLKRLGIEDRVRFYPTMRLSFRTARRKTYVFNPWGSPAPLGFLTGILGFGALRWKDKVSLSRFVVTLATGRAPLTKGRSAEQWLRELKQTPGACRAFWTPLCLATLNALPEHASAAALAAVLKSGFASWGRSPALGYATVSLSKLWSVEFNAFLKRQGGTVAYRQNVTGLETEGDRVTTVVLAGGERLPADVVVSAVPLSSFLKICPAKIRGDYSPAEKVRFSPILGIHLWFEKPVMGEDLMGLLDTRLQWIFRRDRLWSGRGVSPGSVTLIVSGADSWVDKSNEEIVGESLRELAECFAGQSQNRLVHSMVIREKQATPLWDGEPRPSSVTGLKNLFLAGDWTETGLPATLEAACRSGHQAARNVLSYLNSPA
ncbi:MAG TPA: hydroxysqualene dehydroxylase HpnE [Elusimicrobiota bacterium]|nr:hydroxysqualene dehydroxylase HpnE [Elusimicrobiota bacterium]